MRKQSMQYDSPIDALVAVAKRLGRYESGTNMDSEHFFARYTKGELGDDSQFIEWANDDRHYLALRADLDRRLHEAA
jgi:hypothetical protein